MKTKINQRLLTGLALVICQLSLGTLLFSSCSDDESDMPLNFYSSVRETAAGFIEADQEKFGDFKTILERSNYLGTLKTYGHFTVFVPTNEAIQQYLSENGYASVEAMPVEQCDTLARVHIVQDKAYFTSDMGGELSPQNLNGDAIEMTSDSDVVNNNALVIYVNKTSRIIEKDDSVTNGVVHVIDRVITSSNQFLSSIFDENPKLTLFTQALKLTGMADSLVRYVDETYTVDPDSAWDHGAGTAKGFKVPYGTANDGSASKQCPTWYPAQRLFKFTAFVETDSIYRLHGINNIDDLIAYAKQVYDEAFPEDAGKYDADFKDRRNPLNRFVSYHLIDRSAPREYWVHCKGDIYTQRCLFNIYDPEDYYETMCPHTIMRFSSIPGEEIYINRVGLKNNARVRGVRVLKTEEGDGYTNQCKNGRYLYIDDILTYSYDVRWNVLNRRIRIDGSTLSPDFLNGEARMYNMGSKIGEMMIGFKNGFLTNFKMHNANTFIGCGNEQTGWRHYQGSGICITGEKFDASVKLPPVPHDGTYEVRLGYSLGDDRGIAQVYLNNTPCGIPISFRQFDANIGWEPDDPNDEEYNKALDKAMRNRGFMKAMDSYGSTSEPFRTYTNTVRRILTRQYMRANEDYWLRFRQILDGKTLYMSIDYIELCPKDVYDSPEGEDRH